MTDAQSADLTDLLSKQAIHENIMRYCRGVDRCDAGLLASVFHDDAVVDSFPGVGGAAIAQQIVAAVTGSSTVSTHFVGNLLIEVTGDRAVSEAYFLATNELTIDGRRYLRSRACRYIDDHERRGGRWAISNRITVDDWSRLDEAPQRAPGADRWTYGARNPSDPSYLPFSRR
jgi:hypothetical protein